ncbi:MAG: putative methylated-DNA-protein-cysteine methyltransferase [Actinomycetota bacterium]
MATRDVSYFSGVLTAPIGDVTVVASDLGVRYVMFAEDAHPKPLSNLDIHVNPQHPVVKYTLDQLREYFDGARIAFDVPLDLHGTEFQVATWKSLAEIPFGKTISYGEQAASIGRPKAVRAVGGANGRNPVAIVLPCHRVIGANGSLTGFGGGIAVKQWLLQHERNLIARS